MASKYWIKLYHELVDDPKVMTLRPALRWRFIETLLVAGEMDEDGYLPTVREYAWRVRDNEEIVETEFVELLDAGLLSRDDTRFFVTKFAERQAAVSGNERWRKWKERQQKQEYYADETDNQRTANVSLDRGDIDIDTDIDKRIEIDGEEPNADGIYADLSVAFCNKTGIPELTGGPSKWYESLKRLGEAGVKPVDIEKAIDILRDKDYSIVSLRSIEKTAIGEMSKRVGTRGGKSKDPSRLVSGDLAGYIEH